MNKEHDYGISAEGKVNAVIAALLPRIRRRILQKILAKPEQSWSMSELARHLRTRPSSLQRELALLVDIGLVGRRPDGNRVYFKPEKTSPAYLRLRVLFGASDDRAVHRQEPSSKPANSPVLLSRYDREKLYTEVWSQPILDVARKYGVSDVAIGKTCKRLQIPLPGRGYWAKVSAGKNVPKRPPLLPVAGRRYLIRRSGLSGTT